MNPPYQPGLKTLQTLLTPIVRWAVRLGVGYGSFSRMLKPVFFEAAQQELSRQGVRHSDSALSFVSGLHKGDILAFLSNGGPVAEDNVDVNRINPATQVVARWVISGLPRELPLKGEKSFDSLVRETQSDRGTVWSTRLILQDLERRKLVADDGRKVRLLNDVGLPNIDSQEGVVHFVGAVSDHMQASLNNLSGATETRYLEQSLVADGLFPESVKAIHELARQSWTEVLHTVGAKAVECSDRDEPAGGDQRLRLGVYFYAEKANPIKPTPDRQKAQ